METSAKDLPFYVKERVASDECADESDLIELSDDREVQIRLAIAMNPSSSVNVLKRFVDEEEKHVIFALIKREDLPAETVEKISEHLFRDMAELIAQGFSADDLLLDSYLCSNAVSHRNATLKTLTQASRHTLPLVRLGAVCNIGLSSDFLLSMLEEERSLLVVESLLSHPNSEDAVRQFLTRRDVECEGLPVSYLHELVIASFPSLEN